MSGLLEGKTAIITGSGRGIGRATAELFAQHGASIVVSDIDPEPAGQAVESILASGGQATSLPGDATDKAFPDRIVSAAIEKFGGLDIIVNNAGYTWDAVIHKMTDEQWEAILAVHLTAPFRIIRAASTFMRDSAKREWAESGRAHARKIVNISSTSGTRGNPGQSNYSSGKAGVIGLTRTLAKEWVSHIQVNCVAFGGSTPGSPPGERKKARRSIAETPTWRSGTSGATRPHRGDDQMGTRAEPRRKPPERSSFFVPVFELH